MPPPSAGLHSCNSALSDRRLGTGAILRRDWHGQRIEVVIEPDGFRWDGTLWPSLSAIARAATDTRWNGPRFFGLRDGLP
ncbi:DUF2924 domain-containing protein [Roseovarius nitratireducens]|uniref:DUF2924 domain-containing protein n=1 Tax=Roseovarius nitratireducens TaxID=2044597 RepID=UPI000CE1C95B|nr:DUF2924 domain-containing protein [Roseovarius nitratireducens]